MSRDVIRKKVFDRLASEKIDGIIIWGYDNITYLTQIPLPYGQSLPHKKSVLISTSNKAIIVCPGDFAQVVQNLNWDGKVIVSSESEEANTHAEKIANIVKSEFPDVQKWGIDGEHTTAAVWDAIEKKLDITDCDPILRDLRMVKEDFEIRNLTWASRMAERGIVSTLNHTEGTFDAVSFGRGETAERMRVHVAEFGGQANGQVLALQNEDLRLFHGVCHDRVTDNGYTRYDLTASWSGYWSSAGRTIFVGIPDQSHKDAYSDNLKIKKFTVSLLQPGAKCSDVFSQVKAESKKLSIPFMEAAGLGYGVGVTEREAPFLNSSDETILKENMVIAVDVWTFGPDSEWIHSIDTYRITSDGCEKISWYRDYDREIYRMIGITARHG